MSLMVLVIAIVAAGALLVAGLSANSRRNAGRTPPAGDDGGIAAWMWSSDTGGGADGGGCSDGSGCDGGGGGD